jgi:hypothetical protein
MVMNRMKQNFPDDDDGGELPEGMSLDDLFAMAANQVGPRFKIMQKVWLICGEQAGMVIGVTAYSDRFGYVVRWPDGTKDEYMAEELTSTKLWSNN